MNCLRTKIHRCRKRAVKYNFFLKRLVCYTIYQSYQLLLILFKLLTLKQGSQYFGSHNSVILLLVHDNVMYSVHGVEVNHASSCFLILT